MNVDAPRHAVRRIAFLRQLTRRDALAPLLIGLLAGGFAFYRLQPNTDEPGGDFWQHWEAARIVLAAGDPYRGITPTTLRVPADPATAFGNWYFYPLPAAFIGMPFARLPVNLAAALFAGIGAALFVSAVQRQRKPLALCFSVPFVLAGAQSAALLVGATFVPWLAWLVTIKPNLGLALFAYRPSRWIVLGGVLACAVALLLDPTWPIEWFEALRRSPHHHAPVTLWYGGPLLLLGLAAWHEPDGRLLVAMACVPQMLLFYDQLPLMLIPRTEREQLSAAWITWIGFFGWLLSSAWRHGGVADFRDAAPWVLATCYFPALLLVLKHRRQPRVG